MTTLDMRYIQILERRWLKQKWYARFIASNGRILAVTEHYHNLSDLQDMLQTYFPEWPIEGYPVS